MKKNISNKSHLFLKISNESNVKINYSNTKYVAAVMVTRNQNVLISELKNKYNCTFDNKCLAPSIIYNVEATNNKDNNGKYFRNKRSNKKAELSKYFCLLKENGETYTVR